MYYMNKNDYELREQLVFGRNYDDRFYKMGGISYFDCLSIPKLRELLKAGFIDPDEAQNSSPTTQEILDFCSGDDELSGTLYLKSGLNRSRSLAEVEVCFGIGIYTVAGI